MILHNNKLFIKRNGILHKLLATVPVKWSPYYMMTSRIGQMLFTEIGWRR